jgi:cytochrome c nitrite reductase small subunit
MTCDSAGILDMGIDMASTTRRWLPPLLAAAGLGVMVGLGAYTFHEAQGTSYLSNDPKACINCHIMNEQYDGWMHGPHGRVTTCNDCHVPQDVVGKYLTKAEHGWRHSKAFTLNDFHEPIRITPSSLEVVLNNCVRCHDSMVHSVTSPTAIYPTALEPAATNCVHCHARVAHGSTR